ncbi:glycosyltransferase family 9 protein [Helicobacter canis]|nr:glycosyltransferase family 9 protein [Helicobacter canis]
MSTPCIELLLARFPNAKLCLIAPKSILELFSADSRIYACFEDSTKKSKNRLKTTWQLGRAIRSKLEREGGVDIAITLTNHFYSALLLYACGARVRIGYKRGVGNMFLTHKLARAGGPHQVESYARLLDLLPQAESKTLDSSPKSAIPPLRLCAAPKQALDSKPLRIGLNPGAAYGSAKCWDKEHYARVGAHFAALGAEVVVYGVEADRELAEEIVASIDSALGKRDSALGEQCGSVAKIVKGTTAKVANLPQFLQSSHSPTASPRILEENQSSLRAVSAKQSTLESSVQVDSRGDHSTIAESMDCHADFQSARNDRKNAPNVSKQPKDSRINKNAQNVFSPNADRRQDLGDKNGALQGESRAHTWAYVTADSPQQNKGYRSALADVSLESPFLAQKPTPKITNACGQTTIPTLLQELQTLDLFITNDSGSMHIAAALEVPMVAIFGPTNMTETAPWRAKNCILLNLNLPCAPCKKRVCPLGHHKCMKDLRPEMVIEAAHKLLEARQASSNQAQT